MGTTGVILCGGQSTRMQRDKGMMTRDRSTWAQHMVRLLEPVCDDVVISVNPRQENYVAALEGYELVPDNESLGLAGPLLGVLSVHHHHPASDLLVLACDLQNMIPAVPAHLLQMAGSNAGYDAYLFSGPDGSPEPLCALYTCHSLQKIWETHLQQGLPRCSMKYALQQMNVMMATIPPLWQECFYNFNTAADAGLLP
ncbi:MAG TPA: molybdenum cofactor guanylyltransferase [Phnomibacter sp.]|nr:molybdenum cofactor guanylyltransferase [Phnomibacter sp.]